MRVAILILAILLGSLGKGFGQNQVHSDSIRILTWNIFLLSPIAPKKMERGKLIAELLAEGDHDVIVLQEAFSKRVVKKMKTKLDAVYPFQSLPKKRHGLQNNGIWILSKDSILETDHIFYKEKRHFDKLADKGAVRARINHRDLVFDVIGTHTQAEEKPKHFATREAQFQQLKDGLLSDESVPQLIIGDLNTPKRMQAGYDQMLKILDANDGSVLVPEGVSISDSVAITWGCQNNDLIPKSYKGFHRQYDYALIRENGRPLNVTRTLRVDLGQNDKGRFNLSDHYAIDVLIKY